MTTSPTRLFPSISCTFSSFSIIFRDMCHSRCLRLTHRRLLVTYGFVLNGIGPHRPGNFWRAGGVVTCLWNCWRRVDLDIASVQSKDSWLLPMRILSYFVSRMWSCWLTQNNILDWDGWGMFAQNMVAAWLGMAGYGWAWLGSLRLDL